MTMAWLALLLYPLGLLLAFGWRTVAQRASAVGVAPDTIPYYERAGLLPPLPSGSDGVMRPCGASETSSHV